VRVSVLIPAYNEEANIEDTIYGIKKVAHRILPTLRWTIMVIDDGSTDNTLAKAAQCQVQTLKLSRNLGKGGALRHGLKHADGDIIMFLDADLKKSACEAYKLVLPLINNDADVTIARFKPADKPGGLGLVKSLAAGGVKFFTGEHLSTALSGQRAFKRHVLDNIAPIPDGYSLEVGMLIDILTKGYQVVEVDVDMYHDITGRNWPGFAHRGAQFIDILKILVQKLKERTIGA
jgi:glycosyltransferase involved in cell wall biosynthesis